MLRTTLGWLWLISWIVLLYLVAEPWRHLGGVVSERLRWLECAVLAFGFLAGFSAGELARPLDRLTSLAAYRTMLRRWVYPLALITVVTLVTLRYLGHEDSIGVVFSAFLACWAGADTANGALPLMQERGSGRLPGGYEESVEYEALQEDRTLPWV